MMNNASNQSHAPRSEGNDPANIREDTERRAEATPGHLHETAYESVLDQTHDRSEEELTANPVKEMKKSAKIFAKAADWYTLDMPDEAFKSAFRNQVREAIYDTLTDKNQKSKPVEGLSVLTVAVIKKLKVLHPDAWAGFPDSCMTV